MLGLTQTRLESLRDNFRERAQRTSMLLPNASTPAEILNAIEVVEQYGTFCDAAYLMMMVNRRVTHAKREVLRGALDVISRGTVRTLHMEAMMDLAARRLVRDGEEAFFERLIYQLKVERSRAEIALVILAALAAADAGAEGGAEAAAEADLLTRFSVALEFDDVTTSGLIREATEKRNST